MSIVLRHSYLVRDVFVVPFHTKQGIGFHYFCRNSVLHLHQKVPLSAFKRFFKPREAPLKPTKQQTHSKPDPVNEKPVQEPNRIKVTQPRNQERELFNGSVTMGAAPSPRLLPIPKFYVREMIKKSLNLTT
ncbi:unnamed protein product [Microthlaspi erraticum]|uniref:Uncharacterized protein n=1 Tax=Microthlaspi erraticum TaxID=1685480 RepID=A0A6D2I2Y3_9BRAS|nr:unnamed protein product [Microthlaspi erraticum]